MASFIEQLVLNDVNRCGLIENKEEFYKFLVDNELVEEFAGRNWIALELYKRWKDEKLDKESITFLYNLFTKL